MQHKSRFLSLVLGMAAMLILYGPAASQETPRSASTDTTSVLDQVVILEELVVIGSRAKPRSVVESAVPVDVVSSAEILKQGEADLQNLVRTVVPSFNVNTQPISDASTLVRPANLRGLAPTTRWYSSTANAAIAARSSFGMAMAYQMARKGPTYRSFRRLL